MPIIGVGASNFPASHSQVHAKKDDHLMPGLIQPAHQYYVRGGFNRSRRFHAHRISATKAPDSDTDRQGLIEEITAQVIHRLRTSRWALHAGSELDDKLVFVLCSFDPKMDPVFDAIDAAAAAVGLRAERVKDAQGDYRITDRILTLIRRARLVVADLSYEGPNVYFELGYARGIGKTVITILRTGTVVHFDVKDWAYLEYIDSRPLEHQLRDRFRFEIESVRA